MHLQVSIALFSSCKCFLHSLALISEYTLLECMLRQPVLCQQAMFLFAMVLVGSDAWRSNPSAVDTCYAACRF